MTSQLPYTFVALDLETTGLSKETDTIIEVAAIKFHLERHGEKFNVIHKEERSMLIDPERPIDEHISMITGISNAMVQGRKKWGEVREKIQEFIGTESIIVGHNVLFDIGMLSTHGIHLDKHIILDTFELSEIFSGDAESLNLGFLAKKYGFDDGSEHRALDDTRLSLQLFLHYLSDVLLLSETQLSLWEFARKKDQSKTIDTLLLLRGNEEEKSTWHHTILEYSFEKEQERTIDEKQGYYSLVSMMPDWENEETLIEETLKSGKTLIITSSKKQSQWLIKKLSSKRIAHIRERRSYISHQMIETWLSLPQWQRKETILLLRLIHWLLVTDTGNIDELKWYGDEITYKYLFSLFPGEVTSFLRKDREQAEKSELLIAESYNLDTKFFRLATGIQTCLIRDVVELEKSLQFRDTITIDWNTLEKDSADVIGDETIREDFLMGLSIIEDIVKNVKERAKGPNAFPPGDYGETYFFTQKELWHRGYIWLIWAIEKIEVFLENERNIPKNSDIIASIKYRRLSTSLKHLIRLCRIANTNESIVLEIKNEQTRLSLYPRSLKYAIQAFLSIQGGEKNTVYGYHIDTPRVKNFLKEECGIGGDSESRGKVEKFSEYNSSLELSGDKCVILGTNLKNLRALSQELKSKYQEHAFLIQGVSGGKSKIFQLFKMSKKVILLGLIDTWKDESELWEITHSLSILKIPFDPPTDPRFLARTVGMPNNFDNYSLPLAISTINTIIGRAKSSNNLIKIFLCDEKLSTMTWGKNILHELL